MIYPVTAQWQYYAEFVILSQRRRIWLANERFSKIMTQILHFAMLRSG